MRKNQILYIGLVIGLFASCKAKQTNTLFEEVQTNIQFTNTLTESEAFNVFKYRNFYNGGGVATGDLNNDGLPEVFLTANQSSNKLYLNKGNFEFEDITEKAGIVYDGEWSTGVVFVDINSDGWLDIYVCNAGNMLQKEKRKNKLYINNQNNTFSDKAAEYGLADDGYSTQASFFDYDLDGDLDCFLVNNSPIPVNTLNYANMRKIPEAKAPFAEFLKGGGDHLFRNDNGVFKEVTYEAGIYGSIISFGLGVTVGDINLDGYPDIYVSNDFFEKDYLYINQKNGTFKDEIGTRTQHISFSSMGADLQDINNDGMPDIFTTDMLPGDDYRLKTNTSFESYDVYMLKKNQDFFNQFTQNSLQVNNGEGKFLETAFYSGVAASDWSWGALMFDADNDGWSDILVCNGIYRDVTDQDFIDFFANDVVNQMAINGKKEQVNKVIDKMPSVPIPNSMFKNNRNLKFSNESSNWGLDKPSFSNGASYADLDNDGDLDLIINNVNQPATVYKNKLHDQAAGNSQSKNSLTNNKNATANDAQQWMAVQLQYQKPNVFAIGSTVKIFKSKEIITRELIPSKGFQSSVEYKLTIGLGVGSADSIQIIWPNRRVTTIQKPAANQLHKITYDAVSTKLTNNQSENKETALLQQQPIQLDKHTEDEQVDFYIERNIPFMLSKLGPKAAAADVNGDGMEDLFVGGAKGQASQLYLQTKTGLKKQQVKDFEQFKFNDVTAAFFFDADQDGDMDLFVGGGGNAAPAAADLYQNQLYFNDGKGTLTLKSGALQISHTNCGVAIPLDYDNDGKLDIFIGSRSTPQQYGVAPASFLYHNEGNGAFKEVSASVAPFLANLGMITGAVYANVLGDDRNELVVVGEWMYPHIYQFNGKQFQAIKSGLEEQYGWWQTVAAEDLDKDGDLDLVLGNLGENFYLKASKEAPVKLFIKDFDKNGTLDKIFSHTLNGKDMPVFLKKEITEQLPYLKKENLKHQDFASKTIQQVFPNQLADAQVLQVSNAASVLAINNQKQSFSIQVLPYQLQLSSVNAIAIDDFNGDGIKDILTAGNFVDLLPQFCSIDASYGHLLLGKGKNQFELSSPQMSGISINGQIRQILPIAVQQKSGYLFLQNNQVPLYFTKTVAGK